MPKREIRRSIASVQIMLQFASEQGVAADACLQDSNIKTEELGNSGSEITADQELAVIRNLIRELGDTLGIALQLGQRYHLATQGLWGFFVTSCHSYRDVAEQAAAVNELNAAFIDFMLENREGRFVITMEKPELDEATANFLLERDFAAFITATHEVRPGGLPLTRVDFSFPKPGYAEHFRQLCGAKPHFNAKENLMWVDAEALDLPLSQGDPLLSRMFLQQCRQLLEKRTQFEGVSGRVRDVLLQNPSNFPGLEEVASKLFMSSRSLRRKLQEEGSTFRKISDEVHELLAEELLTSADMKLEEVAERLGYAEPSSFIYAFTRWKGMSPNSFRQQYKQNLKK